VQDLVRDTGSTIVCLQETKLSMVDHHVIARTLGSKFLTNYVARPANQTRGGILLAVSEDIEWWITVVYGPQSDAVKLLFCWRFDPGGPWTDE
jgi:hypothetical protein